jgi:hypothetical protein
MHNVLIVVGHNISPGAKCTKIHYLNTNFQMSSASISEVPAAYFRCNFAQIIPHTSSLHKCTHFSKTRASPIIEAHGLYIYSKTNHSEATKVPEIRNWCILAGVKGQKNTCSAF